MPRSTREQAEKTRESVVELACDLGSVEGLESVSIGRIAAELGLSKAGVFGPFGSKLELQLAAVEAAGRSFRAWVWEPNAELEPGLTRLAGLMESWFDYLEGDAFPGGCLMTALSLEFDDRPGPVRDAVASGWELWLNVLAGEVKVAVGAGEAGREVDPERVAFELNALVMGTNWKRRLLPEAGDAIAEGRSAAGELIERIARR